jgi:HD superfamily phosphodiesterase
MTPATLDRLQQSIEDHVTDLFRLFTPEWMTYHNIEHTRLVVRRAVEIAANYELSEVDRFTVIAACWFHDTGQLFTEQRQHEEKSIQMVGEYFKDKLEVSPAIIGNIERCILATKMPQQPGTLLEEIICDADTYHLGTAEFTFMNELVKEEARRKGLDVRNWDVNTYHMLAAHSFHTACCCDMLEQGKQRNMASLLSRIGGQK